VYKVFLTLRYLRSHRIVYFCIVGVMLGIAVLTVVGSIFNGFSLNMRERIRGMTAHLTVRHGDARAVIPDYESLVEEIRKLPHVRGAAPRIEYGAQFTDERRGVLPVMILGIDPKHERGTSDLEKFFRRGGKASFDFAPADGSAPGAFPAVVGKYVGPQVGATLSLQAVRPMTDIPAFCMRDFEVVGQFHTGMNEYDERTIVLPLEAAQEFLKLKTPRGGLVNQIAVQLDDYDAHRAQVNEQIGRILSAQGRGKGYVSVPWESIHYNLLRAVDVEKTIIVMLMFFTVLLAGFNILAIYTLMVRAKTSDIGVIKALGGSTAGVAAIFLMSGLMLSLIGSFIGIVCGLLLSYYTNPVADWIQATTAAVAKWPAGARWEAAAMCGLGPVLLIWIRARAHLKRTVELWAWRVLQIPCLATGLGLGTYLCVKLVEALPEAGWRYGFAGAFLLIGLAYAVTAVRFARRWVSERRPSADLLELLQIPAGVTYWVAATALLLAAVGFASLALHTAPPNWPGLELFPRSIYGLDRIPTAVDYTYVALTVLGAALISLAFSVFPAIVAARQPAIESIRHE
jgi:lipoprotein-releasing system permease protein